MSESVFFGTIRSALRRLMFPWKPKQIVLDKARRPYKGTNKRRKWEYLCQMCKEYHFKEDVAVDHIIECGSLTKFEHLPGFCERLFVEEDGLQVLCKPCHLQKGKDYRR